MLNAIGTTSGMIASPTAAVTGAVSVRDAQRREEAVGFAQVLSRAEGVAERTPEAAREAAEQLVSVALVQPIFERLRASNQAAPPFGPGPGEKTFAGLLDAEFSRRLTTSAQWPLVDSIAARLSAKMTRDEGAKR